VRQLTWTPALQWLSTCMESRTSATRCAVGEIGASFATAAPERATAMAKAAAVLRMTFNMFVFL